MSPPPGGSEPAENAHASPDHVRRRFGAGVALMSASIWLEHAVGFAAFVIIARILGVEAIGLAMMAIAVVTVGETLVRETFSDFIIQRADLDDAHSDAVFWMLMATSGGFVALVWILAPAVGALFNQPAAVDLLRAASLTVVFAGAAAPGVAILRRDLRFEALAWREFAGPVIGAAAGVAAALAGWGPWSIVAQRLAQGLAMDGLVWFAVRWRPRLRVRAGPAREVWSFSSRMLAFKTSEILSFQMPAFAIAATAGPAALGLYAAAWQLVETFAYLLATPVRFVAQPAFAALRRHRAAGASLLRAISEASGLYAFAAFFGLAAAAPALLTLMFGPDWAQGAILLQLLCGVGLYLTLERTHQAFCLALGQSGAMMRFSLIELAAGAALIAAAAPLGAWAVAAAAAARYLLVWPLRLRFTLRLADAPAGPYLTQFAPPALAALAMAVCVVAYRTLFADRLEPLWDLATSVSLGIVLYGLAAALFLRGHLARAAALMRDVLAKRTVIGGGEVVTP